jgi:hypothetical protein
VEKNDVLDAVIGVLGVFAYPRLGGGVKLPSEKEGSCNAAIFASVGVLKGSRFNGGRRSGCRCFFFVGVALIFWSTSDPDPIKTFLLALFELTLTGSRTGVGPDSSFVEELFILLESKGKLDFRLLKNGCSAGDSFGDS